MALLTTKLKRWQIVVGFVISLTVVLGGVATVERNFGLVGSTMGWLRYIDLLAHKHEHSEELKQKVLQPIQSQLAVVNGQLKDISINRAWTDYRQALWQLQALQAKKDKEGQLTWQDQNRLNDLDLETQRLKKRYMDLTSQGSGTPTQQEAPQ